VLGAQRRSPLSCKDLATEPPFRVTVTQPALADTVVDDSRTGPVSGAPRSGRQSHHDLSLLPDVGAVVGDHYRLVRLLGQGMFGKVYVAERLDVPEHRAALKMMPREVYAGRNVERELVMLAAAGHPNVVQLKDHGTTDKYVWLTMPVYEGETLAERLERGTLDVKEAYDIFLPIARGVEALHAAGLRHQDLKPENIFLAQFAGRLHPIILDLGVAAEISSTFVAGTILFGAPEQIDALNARIKMAVSEKIDTYCLAATLLLALVGEKQFPGADAHSREEIFEAQKERATKPLRDDALVELEGRPREMLAERLCRWLAMESEDRASVGEMAEDLDVLLEREREAEAQAHRRVIRQQAMIRNLRLGVAGFLVAAIGLIGYGYTKRSTLRMANELQKARAEGAQQFDKLETCAASHRIAESESAECKARRERDQADFKRNLDALSQSGAAQGACATQIESYTTRLRVCEDTAGLARKACATEKEQVASEWTTRAGQLAAEKEELKKAADKCTADASRANADLEKARGELKACVLRVTDNPYVEPSAAPPPPPAAAPPPPPRPSAPAASTPPPAAPPPASAAPPPAPTAAPAPPPTAAPPAPTPASSS
jgi:eukaryotic-like serine/threonine-protein kinase